MWRLWFVVALLLAQIASPYPEAAWIAPGVVRLMWWQTEDGEACAFVRHEGTDTALGCVAGVYDVNTRVLTGDYQAGDMLWIYGAGAALPLEAPSFVFVPGVTYGEYP